jgi:hypothetical protein
MVKTIIKCGEIYAPLTKHNKNVSLVDQKLVNFSGSENITKQNYIYGAGSLTLKSRAHLTVLCAVFGFEEIVLQ